MTADARGIIGGRGPEGPHPMTIKAKLRDLFYSTAWRFAPGLHSAVVAQRRPDKPVDPRITYPSFSCSSNGCFDR